MSVAEARSTTEFVVQVEIEEARFTLSAVTSLDVLFASTKACFGIARCRVVPGAVRVAIARLTSMIAEVEVIGFASIALITANSSLALTLSFRIALQRSRSGWVAVAVRAVAIFAHVEVLLTSFTVGSVAVGGAVHTVTSMSSQIVQIAVKVALVGVTITVARLAFVGILRCSASPRCVVIKRQTLFAIRSIGEVLTLANLLPFHIRSGAIDALVRVSIALATRTNCNISDGIEI